MHGAKVVLGVTIVCSGCGGPQDVSAPPLSVKTTIRPTRDSGVDDHSGLDGVLEDARHGMSASSRAAPFPVLLDPGQAGVDRLGIRGKPATYIVESDGAVQFAHVGVDPADRPSVEFLLRKLDQRHPQAGSVVPPDTGPIRDAGVAFLGG